MTIKWISPQFGYGIWKRLSFFAALKFKEACT